MERIDPVETPLPPATYLNNPFIPKPSQVWLPPLIAANNPVTTILNYIYFRIIYFNKRSNQYEKKMEDFFRKLKKELLETQDCSEFLVDGEPKAWPDLMDLLKVGLSGKDAYLSSAIKNIYAILLSLVSKEAEADKSVVFDSIKASIESIKLRDLKGLETDGYQEKILQEAMKLDNILSIVRVYDEHEEEKLLAVTAHIANQLKENEDEMHLKELKGSKSTSLILSDIRYTLMYQLIHYPDSINILKLFDFYEKINNNDSPGNRVSTKLKQYAPIYFFLYITLVLTYAYFRNQGMSSNGILLSNFKKLIKSYFNFELHHTSVYGFIGFLEKTSMEDYLAYMDRIYQQVVGSTHKIGWNTQPNSEFFSFEIIEYYLCHRLEHCATKQKKELNTILSKLKQIKKTDLKKSFFKENKGHLIFNMAANRIEEQVIDGLTYRFTYCLGQVYAKAQATDTNPLIWYPITPECLSYIYLIFHELFECYRHVKKNENSLKGTGILAETLADLLKLIGLSDPDKAIKDKNPLPLLTSLFENPIFKLLFTNADELSKNLGRVYIKIMYDNQAQLSLTEDEKKNMVVLGDYPELTESNLGNKAAIGRAFSSTSTLFGGSRYTQVPEIPQTSSANQNNNSFN